MENTDNLKAFSDKRKERAKQMLEVNKPTELNDYTYLVPSQTDTKKSYHVTHIDSYSCECIDFQQRCKGNGLYCKHIQSVLLLEKLKIAIQTQPLITRL